MQRDVLTVLEATSTLNLHPETVKRFCRIGKLKGEKVSVGWLIPRREASCPFGVQGVAVYTGSITAEQRSEDVIHG